jgi:ABC-type branched-chain amino acid transport systems, ATPase component
MTANQTILSLEGVRKSFGGAEIIRGVDLQVRQGERHAVIGPNGAGKSTLFHLISGSFAPSAGRIRLRGQDIAGLPPERVNRMGLARSFQITNVFPRLTVRENLRLAVLRMHGLSYHFWRPVARHLAVNDDVDRLLETVRLAARRDVAAGDLNYSEQRSLEIGMTLASRPSVILLDEPMAGMSQHEVDYTVGLIQDVTRDCTLLIVEHDMQVVFSLAHRISVLVYGEILATGTPDEIRANAAVREAYLGEQTV